MNGLMIPVSTGASDLHHQLDTLRAFEALMKTSSDSVEPADIRELLRGLSEVSTSSAGRHEFYYRATIVSLYGLLEQFVESMLTEVVHRLAEIVPGYDSLPDNLKSNHLPLTLDVLSRLTTGKYQGKATERMLISGLNSCYEESSEFVLNDMVFAYHTANFRADVVRQSFEKIGIELAKLASERPFAASMEQNFPDEGNIFFVVDDLAERRNEVAHGSVTQLLSVELLHSYIDVIEAYTGALTKSVLSWLIKFAIPYIGRELGRPTKVFGNRIIGYSSLALSLSVGDVIAVVDGRESATCSRISSIEVDRAPVQTAVAGSSVGIDTGIRATARSRIFLFP
jgi:hypothetical protein